ncbi:MAG: hypothetical protein EBZ69_01350 [Alphaproteobacteria bacterium]|nr:hypothetical protein [Alphaproteobacteria bacterium]
MVYFLNQSKLKYHYYRRQCLSLDQQQPIVFHSNKFRFQMLKILLFQDQTKKIHQKNVLLY